MADAAAALARTIDELTRKIDSYARASQLSRSTVSINGADMPVPDAIGDGVRAGIEVENVREQLDQARADLEAAQAALADNLAAAEQLIADAGSRLSGAESQITDAFGRIDDAEAALGAAVALSLDEYVVTGSQTVPPGSDAAWSADTPDWSPGEFVWRRVKNTHIDGSVTYGAPVVITGVDGAPGEDAVLLRVASSRGTSFKNNSIATVLTVTVFKGSQQITNVTGLWATLGSGAYLEWWWRRIDDTDFGVISSADPRLSQAGFALTVSPADVDEQTVFQCVLHS